MKIRISFHRFAYTLCAIKLKSIMFTDIESQLEGIREIFAEAKREDNWNPDEPMLYSFYFVDTDVDKLKNLVKN